VRLRNYCDAIKAAVGLDDLRLKVATEAKLAPDAMTIVQRMTAEDFIDFKKHVAEQDGGDEWSERFGAVLLPELFLLVGHVEATFHVPTGLALRRLVDIGWLTDDADAYHLTPDGEAAFGEILANSGDESEEGN
jgi:hypothetical protein